jgi:hypothetical protein
MKYYLPKSRLQQQIAGVGKIADPVLALVLQEI